MDLVLKMMKTALYSVLDTTLRLWASWEEELSGGYLWGT